MLPGSQTVWVSSSNLEVCRQNACGQVPFPSWKSPTQKAVRDDGVHSAQQVVQCQGRKKGSVSVHRSCSYCSVCLPEVSHLYEACLSVLNLWHPGPCTLGATAPGRAWQFLEMVQDSSTVCLSWANQPIQGPHPNPSLYLALTGLSQGPLLPHPSHCRTRHQTPRDSPCTQGLLESFQVAKPPPAHPALLVPVPFHRNHNTGSFLCFPSLPGLLTAPAALPCAPSSWGQR